MLRRPAVSRYERQRFLEELENGVGITEIARRAGRDIRVVKRNLDIAEQDRELARARRGFIRGRLEQHQEDLLAEVSRLKEVARRGSAYSLEPEDCLKRKVHEGLKQHVKRQPLHEYLAAARR